MSERPALDPETHADDTVTSVWKRRLVLAFLIVLVVAVAAPTFGGCSGTFSTKKTVATFEVDGTSHVVTEDDVQRLTQRLVHTLGFLGQQRFPEGDEGTKQVLLYMMLDASAKAAGVHVPDAQVTQVIESLPQFQVGGKFDERRYRTLMSEYARGALTHEVVVETLRMLLRVGELSGISRAPSDLTPGDEAYEAWKKQNVRISVEYVAAPYEVQKAKFDAVNPTDEDLQKIAGLPAVKALLAVPQRKTVEVAYLRITDLGPEQFAAARKFAEDSEIYTEDRPLQNDAFILFHDNRDHVFTKAHWVKLQDPDYESKRTAYEKDHAAWEKEPKEGRRAEPPAPKDPGDDYPAPEKQFPLWRERAEKEALARAIVARLGEVAEKDGRTLAEVGAEYARFGVKVVKNAEPLADADIVAKFPDPVARDSEFDQVVITEFKPLAEGATFKPRYHAKPVPTTRLADRLDDRGYMVFRLDSCEPARQYALAERREPVVEFWRRYQTTEGARALAEEIRKKTEAAGPDVDKMVAAMRQAAADAGLKAESITRFGRSTDAPKPPTAEAGGTLSPELAALARRLTLRGRVQSDYQLLSGLAPGKLREPVLADEKVEAAFAILVTEKHEPKPVEMSDDDLRRDRYIAANRVYGQGAAVFEYDAVAKRVNLQRLDEAPTKAAAVKPADR